MHLPPTGVVARRRHLGACGTVCPLGITVSGIARLERRFPGNLPRSRSQRPQIRPPEAASASIIFWIGAAAVPPTMMPRPTAPSVSTVLSHTIVVTGSV
jgi:hypothetical protein